MATASTPGSANTSSSEALTRAPDTAPQSLGPRYVSITDPAKLGRLASLNVSDQIRAPIASAHYSYTKHRHTNSVPRKRTAVTGSPCPMQG